MGTGGSSSELLDDEEEETCSAYIENVLANATTSRLSTVAS